MKKKIKKLVIISLVLSILNTIGVLFLIGDKAYASYKNRPVVISRDYDKGQSMELALQQDKPIIVWFYTDWCRYCQKFVPTFKKLTKQKEIKENYAVAYINAENPANDIYVKAYNIEGFPTVYLVKDGKTELIESNYLFSPTAIETIKNKMMEFIK